MSKYKPHAGEFYCDIGDGTDLHKIDFCFIHPENSEHAIMILKHLTEVAAIDFKELLEKKEKAKVLNYKNFITTNLAYEKMMKWIGKMVKKSVLLDDNSVHKSRYYNNVSHKDYTTPLFLFKKQMQKVYDWMESVEF